MNTSSPTTQSSKDKIKRNVEKSIEDAGMSPMNPPEYTNPPAKINEIPYNQLPKSIKILVDEHKAAIEKISKFENALIQFNKNNYTYTQELSTEFRNFFEFFDNKLIPHHQKEDKYLFPLLEKYLIKKGEHSKYMNNNKYETPVDLMEDDHLKIFQAGSLIFNLLGIFVRIPDPVSRGIIADIIYNKGIELIDLLRIHIYQEENILFPQSVEFLSKEESAQIEKYIK